METIKPKKPKLSFVEQLKKKAEASRKYKFENAKACIKDQLLRAATNGCNDYKLAIGCYGLSHQESECIAKHYEELGLKVIRISSENSIIQLNFEWK